MMIISNASMIVLARLGSPLIKMHNIYSVLVYGVPGDLVDDHVRMSESTCPKALYKFFRYVVRVLGPAYLQQPNAKDTTQLLEINAARGFSGMLGNIDCMHWEGNNFPFPLQGMYK